MVRVFVATFLLLILTIVGRAQPRERLSFEVASIKQNTDAGAKPTFVLQPGGGVTITSYGLHQLIAIAYDSPSIQTRDQIVGGPAWIKTDRFDIVAKAIGSLDADENGRETRLHAMMRSLFEERFKLRMHSEYRQATIYLLMLANKDGRLGPQLRRSTQQDCSGPIANVAPEDSSRWCGWRGFGTGHDRIQGQTMDDLARGFASAWSIGRPIFDRTGLSGRWDVQLEYVPAFVAGPNSGSGPVPNPGADSGPDMLAALRDQLGLKLQSGRAAIEYLVIDHVERPSAD